MFYDFVVIRVYDETIGDWFYKVKEVGTEITWFLLFQSKSEAESFIEAVKKELFTQSVRSCTASLIQLAAMMNEQELQVIHIHKPEPEPEPDLKPVD